MTPEELMARFLEFGSQVIDVVEKIPATLIAPHVRSQLMRSATSVGANYAEAQSAESKADFTHKLQISLKECRESHYWLQLLVLRTSNQAAVRLANEAFQLILILSKSVVTAKSRP